MSTNAILTFVECEESEDALLLTTNWFRREYTGLIQMHRVLPDLEKVESSESRSDAQPPANPSTTANEGGESIAQTDQNEPEKEDNTTKKMIP